MPIDQLPEELLLTIFSHFDTSAPSERKSRQEPSLQLTASDLHPLKDISLVSRTWRRIVLPILFCYTRLKIRGRASFGHLCRLDPFADVPGIEPPRYPDDFEHHLHTSDNVREYHAHFNREAKTRNIKIDLTWSNKIYHALTKFLQFLTLHSLGGNVHSFTLLTSSGIRVPVGDEDAMYKDMNQRDYILPPTDPRYRVTTAFWRHLFSVTIPARIVVVAPPADLGVWIGCEVDMAASWAFDDMKYHVLELKVGEGMEKGNGGEIVNPQGGPLFDSNGVLPHNGIYGSTKTSILRMRPWTHLSLNEGSFLAGYATGEYIPQHGPPSTLSSICGHISLDPKILESPSEEPDMPALHSFTYTAILPFASHVRFTRMLPHLSELDVKLAPDPESGILQDPARVGKAVQLGDCWREFFASYEAITTPLRTAQLGVAGVKNAPKLKRFVCRDVTVPGLTLELDDEFTPMCLPCWSEPEPGVFERLALVPPVYH